jgi:predicted ATPase
MVENAGQVVSRDQIVAIVWQNAAISDSAVSTQASVVRTLVGNDDSIVAVNNQGYVFTLKVQPIEEEYQPSPYLLRLAQQSGPGVGREAELTALAELCLQHRVVTVVGPGGVGKTWLAVNLGLRLAWNCLDGVHLVDLSAAKDAISVAGTVAQTLGIALRSSDDPTHILANAIGKQRMLLILDSCEYVTEAVRNLVNGLLAAAPNLSVLATSQEILRLRDEVIFRVEPLSPEYAVQLFFARAQAADRYFLNDAENAAIVSEICRRLDGMPLALEMAASLVPKLGIERVRDGLDQQRFRMLDGSPHVADKRRATLTAVVEWSYGLLDEADRLVFCRLARFSGSFSLDAVLAVAGADGADDWDVAASLGRLVDKSLLVAERGRRPRYHLLETLHLYAARKLKESGESETIAERHARYYVDLFQKADEAWETMPDAGWTALYGPEIDNLRVAMDWAMAEPARLPLAITLGGAGAHLWERLNLSAEGRGYLDRLVERLDDNTPVLDSARVLKQAGMLWRRSERLPAVALTERSLQLYRQSDDKPGLGAALGFAGGDDVFLGRYDEARAALTEAQALLAGSNRIKSSLRVMIDLGTLAQRENRVDDAKSALQAARDLARTLRDPLREYITVNNLAALDFRMGNVARSTEHFRDAANGLRSLAQPAYLGVFLTNLAGCLTLTGADAEARTHATEALSLTRVDGGSWLHQCLECWAFLAARAGQYAESAQLLGFVDAGVVRSGEVREPLSQRVYDEVTRLLAAHCRAEDIRAWADDGARWSEAQAADFAERRLIIAGT